jgi:tetratricopeptide (TPR) repeat protein
LRIAEAPASAPLHFKRAELHRAHRQWEAALADYARAAALDPDLAAVDLGRGLLFIETDAPRTARDALDRFLARHPAHAEARAARARALVRLGEPEAAAADLTAAIAASPRPRPEYFTERAQVIATGGESRIAEALRGLDEGIARLGPLVTLQLLAIELELKRHASDAALDRVETLAAVSPRKETWLTRRGEILEQAGRLRDARLAYAAALEAIGTLPESRRGTRAADALAKRVRAGIERVAPAAGSRAAAGQVSPTQIGD